MDSWHQTPKHRLTRAELGIRVGKLTEAELLSRLKFETDYLVDMALGAETHAMMPEVTGRLRACVDEIRRRGLERPLF